MRAFFLLTLSVTFLFSANAYAIHDDPGETDCLDCHYSLPFDRHKLSYTENVDQICRTCHPKFPCDEGNISTNFIHPNNVVPLMKVPNDMPLDIKGKLSCITCHLYHAESWNAGSTTSYLLRRSTIKKLCLACHENL